MKRRDFLLLSVTSLLAACGPEAMGEAAPSTRTRNTPTATVTPLATATPTATPSPTPAAAGCGVSAVSEFESGLETVLEDYLPGCEVSIATLPPGNHVAALLQAAGTLPDIYIGAQVNPQALSFACADLSDLVEELVGEFGALNPHCAREIVVEGAAYAVPFHAWGKGAWVRRDLFEEAGLDLDSMRTYEQLREQCLAFSLSAGFRRGA